jgi:hypothetical protein
VGEIFRTHPDQPETEYNWLGSLAGVKGPRRGAFSSVFSSGGPGGGWGV